MFCHISCLLFVLHSIVGQQDRWVVTHMWGALRCIVVKSPFHTTKKTTTFIERFSQCLRNITKWALCARAPMFQTVLHSLRDCLKHWEMSDLHVWQNLKTAGNLCNVIKDPLYTCSYHSNNTTLSRLTSINIVSGKHEANCYWFYKGNCQNSHQIICKLVAV